MIYNKVNSQQYKDEFVAKFSNYGEKAPIMLSFATDDIGVHIVHENSGIKYTYEWDYTVPVKSFIHMIKKQLSDNHYPRIVKKETVTLPISPEKQADLIAEGKLSIEDDVPVETKEVETIYRIDKILAMRDEFVLINEETKELSYYKMNDSSIFFLRNYRNGKYKDIAEAGDVFFKKCTLLKDGRGKISN